MSIEQAINKIKRGTYASAIWQSVDKKTGATKISRGVVRVLTNVLINKEGVKYTRFFLTHNNRLKTISNYFFDGVEISKEEYESIVKPNDKIIDVCFAKHIDDIIFLGNKATAM